MQKSKPVASGNLQDLPLSPPARKSRRPDNIQADLSTCLTGLEEGSQDDAGLHENFVLRAYAYRNFHEEVMDEPSLHKLIQFHSSYKYVLMAHSVTAYRELGRRLGKGHQEPVDTLVSLYLADFMAALSKPATVKNHTNTLMHILGYLKKSVSSQTRQHILEIIHQYRTGQLPLVAPLTLLKHHIEQTGSDYIRAQRYLQLYPEDLGFEVMQG